ncbi:hypothetical protein [Antrihabitans sp. YC2-6]|uniref:hypothetical protein n=1 Tax=Antrihabitans sp. YC2-6 TaxID=2799498 RepID=UPI0035A85043
MNELVVALKALSDQELRDVVRDATQGRPGLSDLHEAASGQPVALIPATPDVPAPLQLPTSSFSPPDYTAGGVPTFDRVRDKVRERLGRSVGSSELNAETSPGRSVQEQWQEREEAGHKRLEEIRRAMHTHDSDDTKGTE